MKSRLKKARSRVHGFGCFATETIPAGSLIGYCETKPTRREGMYTLSLPDGGQVDVTCVLRYINHSDTPNCRYYDDLSVEALCDIQAGEELLHDYESS
jgi:hypothetical protein